MSTRLSRWGNSLGLRIPYHIAQVASLKAGDQMYVRLLDSGDILVSPVDKGNHPGCSITPVPAPKPLTDADVRQYW